MQHKIFCVCEFVKTESATAVRRAFRLTFNIQPPTRKSVCCWNHQFEQIGCLCKGKSSGRPRVSEENVRRIKESFERSPRKSNRRASRELGIPQPTVWRLLRRRLLFKPYRIQLVQALRPNDKRNWVHLFKSHCTFGEHFQVCYQYIKHQHFLSGILVNRHHKWFCFKSTYELILFLLYLFQWLSHYNKLFTRVSTSHDHVIFSDV